MDPKNINNIISQFNVINMKEKEEKDWFREQINKKDQEIKELRERLMGQVGNNVAMPTQTHNKPIQKELSTIEKQIYDTINLKDVITYEDLHKKMFRIVLPLSISSLCLKHRTIKYWFILIDPIGY